MRSMFALSGVALVCLAGCGQPISQEKTVEMTPGEHYAPLLVAAPAGEQKITVEFTSTESPIDVYVILGKDEEAIMRELEKASPKVDTVAKKTGSKGDTLTATIPAKKDYGVYLTNASKKTKATVKLKGQ